MSEERPARSRRAGGARRTVVLDHVAAVLADRGYAGTRFADVSEASGVAVSTLQGYFGSREDMLIEAFERATAVAVDAMHAVVARIDDPWEQLVAMVDRGLTTDVVVWRMLMEFWTAAAHDGELRDGAAELAAQYRRPYADAITRGTEAGAFAPRFAPDAIVEATIAHIVGLLYPVVLGHLAPRDVGYRDVVLGQLAFALGTRADHASETPWSPHPHREGTSMPHTIVNPDGLHDAVPFGYSHSAAVPAGTDLVFVAGQYGSGPDGAVVSDDFAQQVTQAFRNLGVALEAHGLDLAHVVQLRTYVVGPDMEKLATIGRAVAMSCGDLPPTQTVLGVAALAMPDILFEVEAVAARP